MRADEQVQWQALAIAPLSSGGGTGLRMDATDEVEPIAVVPVRKVQPVPVVEPVKPAIARRRSSASFCQ